MKTVSTLLLSGSLLLVASSGVAQVVSVTQAPKVTAVSGQDLHRARKVLKRFFASESHPECYEVLFSPFQGNLRVDFVPKHRDPVRYEGQPEKPEEPSCGRNVGYVLDRRGNILRNIYSR